MANKKRKCRYCKDYHIADDMIIIHGAAYCSMDHVAKYAQENRLKGQKILEKEDKEKRIKAKKDSLKTRKEAAKKACHEYIRERDKFDLCICCNQPLGENYHAGHYLESGNNPQIRYDEDNIHAQKLSCNFFKGGDSGFYRVNLIKKIGTERVEKLESMTGGTVKRTADDYREIERYYKDKLKKLKLDRENQ